MKTKIKRKSELWQETIKEEWKKEHDKKKKIQTTEANRNNVLMYKTE